VINWLPVSEISMDSINYKVGDKIVEFGRVFRIFKIKRQKGSDGKIERVIFFKPYYNTSLAAGIVCSIPVKNIDKTVIRNPLSKQQVNFLLKRLKKRKKVRDLPPITDIKELLNTNKPLNTVRVIRMLYSDEKIHPDAFPKSKRDVFDSAMDKLVQEVAVVSGISLEKARRKIDLYLHN